MTKKRQEVLNGNLSPQPWRKSLLIALKKYVKR